MTNPLTFRVAAGPHSRWRCPISTAVTETVELSDLHRVGRARPIPSQLEATSAGKRLWWTIDDLQAGAVLEHELRLGRRRRHRPPRLRLAAVDHTWEARCCDELLANIDLTADHAPQIRPRRPSACDLVLHVGQTGQCDRFSIHRSAAQAPNIVAGPVFCQLVVQYRCEDRMGLPIWSETHQVRCFEGTPDFLALDYELRIVADVGPIRLTNKKGQRHPWLPAPLLSAAADLTSNAVLAPGWSGSAASAAKPSPFAITAVGDCHVGLFVRSDSQGFAPIWSLRDGAIQAIPTQCIGENSAYPSDHLPLGGSARWGLRMILFRADDPLAFATARYFDFDCPPAVTCLS